MTQFKSNFAAASSITPNEGFNNNASTYAHKRPALLGFLSSGSISGNVKRSQITSLTGFISGVELVDK